MKKILIVSIILLSFGSLTADGGIFPPPGEVMYESHQHAIIQYDGSTEVLHLLVSIYNEYGEGSGSFGWIVPVPAVPEIAEDSIALFEQITEMCAPVWGGGWGCIDYYDSYYDEYGNEILDQGIVGSLEYRTIQASSADSLFAWLADNEYTYPDSSHALNVFSDYIERDWVFVVFNVNAGSEYYEANIQPVKFTFSSDQIVFPMRITSLNYHPDSTNYVGLTLLLHVIADHRVKVDQGNGEYYQMYANKLSSKEYGAVQEHYPLVAEICGEDDFLTRIGSYLYELEDLDSDYVLIYADQDWESYSFDVSGLALLPLALMMGPGWGLFKRIRRKRRKA